MNSTLLTLESTLNAVNGSLVCKPSDSNAVFSFTSVVTDSRNATLDSLFVPLVGEKQDGHIYIRQAVKNGAKVVFAAISWVENNGNEIAAYSAENIWIIAVENTLSALQAAASAYVEQFPNLIRIGITGSSGKTTTKEIAVSVVSQGFNVISTQGNLNSETGLPLSVFNIRKEHQVGIFEMGMNRKNEMAELAFVLKPQYVIITNIGTAHIGILGSRQAIAFEKKSACKYFNKESVLFVPENDDFADYLSEDLLGRKVCFGINSMNRISKVVDDGLKGTKCFIDNVSVSFPLYGEYNFNNALSVVALAFELSISVEKIKQGLETVKPLFGRAEIIEKEYTVIQDCYNANPDSMNSAISFCVNLKTAGRKFLILGDMLELGVGSKVEHEKIGSLVNNKCFFAVVFVGSNMKNAFERAQDVENKMYFSDLTDANVKAIGDFFIANLNKDDLVLVKGSRGMTLEKVLKYVFSEGDKNE